MRHVVTQHPELATEEEKNRYRDKASDKVPCPICKHLIPKKHLKAHLERKNPCKPPAQGVKIGDAVKRGRPRKPIVTVFNGRQGITIELDYK